MPPEEKLEMPQVSQSQSKVLYYENRHRARIYLAESVGDQTTGPGAKWFPLSGRPSDEKLAFAVDVRTIEKWASENGMSRP